MAENPVQVRRRHVFYIPGYDPIHPRRYRELYRREGAAQAAISGYEIALSPKHAGGAYGWHVDARIDGQAVESDFEVLVWSDLVRDSMGQSIAATYWQMARTAWTYIASGALFRLARLRKGPTIAALYPVAFLLGQLALALMVARGAGAVLALSGLPFVGWLGLGAVWPVLAWFRAHDNKVFAYYLMHDYAHSASRRGAYPPDLEARLRDFADRIAEATAKGADEVLIVGHSSGAHLAVSILADLIRADRLPKNGPAVALLSLGQVVPMISFLPRADRLRADLALMAAQDRVPWVDVTGPGDGCAFALCDPVAVSGVAPAGQRWPLVVSAAFTQTLSPERWRELRWRFFRLHFQYLCAFDRPGDYDYFRLTAGPRTLGATYAGRKPSPSRITAPLSPYITTEAP
ncbi:hypothetical protein [Rhodovulum adriaticum]|uniref:Alpha/beta hydrolase family protein n=1 Tax=Rhodovulum adriaticum TaxID=35804 RepID=A0A4R2NUN9_RHOAD|nr:hypothetical protein [Rhodovulum adriaticum]MBK1635094.1 hypothetical protein [Rhodovulum adriaticum]TCP25271.1 hypothetical protein EV656_10320 [Rhodovulum adriaticum]